MSILSPHFNSGMRVTEAFSIKVENFTSDFKQLTIPDEVSKTFGRKITLKLCSNLIAEYVQIHGLKPDDYIMLKKPPAFNKYLGRLSESLFGDKKSPARKNYSRFSLYDIRHNSSCFWLKRYPNSAGLMYRMGWSREDKIKYYSEFLGMADEITYEDMITGDDKGKLAKLEVENQELRKELEIVKAGFLRLENRILLFGFKM